MKYITEIISELKDECAAKPRVVRANELIVLWTFAISIIIDFEIFEFQLVIFSLATLCL